MKYDILIPHLFRTESAKLTAVLCKWLGVEHIQLVEDITGETFLTALETWPYNGIPANPVAWLYAVAKNKANNAIRRNNVLATKISILSKEPLAAEFPDIDLSEQNITDSQLQMMFAVCHPALQTEAQVALALRLLCGFGIDEIANAFLTSRDAISKRLVRAKEKLRTEKIAVEFPPVTAIPVRLQAVLTTLYLLFNEGYYSESNDEVLRNDFCLEAMRLVYLLIENEQTSLPAVKALFALMCFHASRFAARQNEKGEMVLYQDQDETLWNQELIAKGVYFLHEASGGNALSSYHIEAGIAYWHTIKADTTEKWEQVLQLYNRLLQINYSPIAALNRTYALAKTNGKEAAIREAEKLRLTSNHFWHLLLGELYTGKDLNKARQYLQQALALAKTKRDKQSIQKRIDQLIG